MLCQDQEEDLTEVDSDQAAVDADQAVDMAAALDQVADTVVALDQAVDSAAALDQVVDSEAVLDQVADTDMVADLGQDQEDHIARLTAEDRHAIIIAVDVWAVAWEFFASQYLSYLLLSHCSNSFAFQTKRKLLLKQIFST